jgi:lysyl-tRNA synthetase class 1
MALEIKSRVERDEQLSKLVDEQGLLVYDEKTPSGIIHIGSGRGWVIHDVVAKCLRDLGLRAKFVLSSDDYDPYDRPNKDLDPAVFDQHLGKPFSEIPSPVDGFSSFGAYYFDQATSRFSELGIECDFESTADNYKKGLFNPHIKTILDQTEKVQGIYRDLYGPETGGASKIPFNCVCAKCGRIATTKAIRWDSEKEEIEYECRDDVVSWAKGCGHRGWRSPYNGGGKFPWKVEWAAKWPTRGVVVEFGGKDHFSKGGSRTCANKIAVDILSYPPPYPSHGYKTGPGYEFFQIGGAKMSTSKGKGMSFSDGVQFFPGEMLRFLLLRSRPNSVVDFDPEKNDILLLCDQFDRMERIHFGIDEPKDEADKAVQSALYNLVSLGEPRKTFAPQIPLNLAATILQITLSKAAAMNKLVEMSHLPDDLDQEQCRVVMGRLELAERWVENYAAEQFIFRLVDEASGSKSCLPEDKGVLIEFISFLAELPNGLNDSKVLHNGVYELARSQEWEPKAVFNTVYRALIEKERGPQLANFILTIGIEKTSALLAAGLKNC